MIGFLHFYLGLIVHAHIICENFWLTGYVLRLLRYNPSDRIQIERWGRHRLSNMIPLAPFGYSTDPKNNSHFTFLQRLQEVADEPLHLRHMSLLRVNNVFKDHISESLDL